MSEIHGRPGVYGGMIVPIRIIDGTESRVDKLSREEEEYTREYVHIHNFVEDKTQIEMANKRIHKVLAKQALFCDHCHNSKGVLKFRQLLYSTDRASHLESLDMASMVSTYKEFHLPSVFE